MKFSALSADQIGENQIRVFLKRKAFMITETEEKLIAAPAIIGLRRIPKNG